MGDEAGMFAGLPCCEELWWSVVIGKRASGSSEKLSTSHQSKHQITLNHLWHREGWPGDHCLLPNADMHP